MRIHMTDRKDRSGLCAEFIRYTALSVLGTLGVSCYILADTWFIAEGLGSTGLAALNLAIPVYSFLCGIGTMLGMGGATQFALAKAGSRNIRPDRIYSITLILGFLFAVPFAAAGILCPDQTASLLGADGQTLVDTSTYLRWLMIFSPAFLVNYILQAFLRNDHSPHLSTAAMVAGSFINIVLDWYFIFPCAMGMFGAILATCLSPVFSILVMLPHFFSKRNTLAFRLCSLDPSVAAEDLSLGFPSLITQLSAGIVMIVLNSLILKLAGNIGVAAYGVIANMACVVTAVFNGIAQGMQPLVSAASAADNLKKTRILLRYGMAAVLLFSAVLCLAVQIFPEQIAALFNSEHNMQLQKTAVQGLRLYFLSTPFAGFCIVLSTWFASVSHPRPAHVLSLQRGILLVIPLAFLFAALWQMTGIWFAVPAAELITSLTGLFMYRRFLRKREPESNF